MFSAYGLYVLKRLQIYDILYVCKFRNISLMMLINQNIINMVAEALGFSLNFVDRLVNKIYT
ncbi:hypothetical protein bsdE14_02870 [Clostridium omnivorum]|uniref:Uncharacterized protein n=1 Tax=Clostridium omnivorum TaxID=1604902 RepID=A0ABQ5N108_9CLOT|nr:hypothetical protein bsdE14_02870 [Clostridium sp. E14]